MFVRIPGAVDRAARRRPGERAAQHPRGRRGRGLAARPPRAARVGRLRARMGRRRDDVERGAPGAGDAGAHRRGAAAAPCRPAVPRRLRHVPARRAIPARSSTSATSRSRPAIASTSTASRAIEAALAVHPLPTRPVPQRPARRELHRHGERLWIVDYEYSGNDDPTFELGNTAQELGYDEAQLARAVRGVLRRGVTGHARRGCTCR